MELALCELKKSSQYAITQARNKITLKQYGEAAEAYEKCINYYLAAIISNYNEDELGKEIPKDEETQLILSSLLNCIVKPKGGLCWKSVIGCERAKESLNEAIVWPLTNSWFFSETRKPWNAVLLYGPPGVAKTRLVEIAASISKAVLFVVRGSDIKSMWSGRSEKYVKSLFQMARNHPLSVVFLDEIDALCQSRSGPGNHASNGILQELLAEMTKLSELSTTVVVAATNVPQQLDPAIIRRFQCRIFVDIPKSNERADIIKLYMKNCVHELTEKDFTLLAKKTNRYSGSDLEIVCQYAKMQPLRRMGNKDIKDVLEDKVTKLDMLSSLRINKSSASIALMEDIKAFQNKIPVLSQEVNDKAGCFSSLKGVKNSMIRLFV